MERLTFEQKIKQAEERESKMTLSEIIARRAKSQEEINAVNEGRVSQAQIENINSLREQIVYQSQ